MKYNFEKYIPYSKRNSFNGLTFAKNGLIMVTTFTTDKYFKETNKIDFFFDKEEKIFFIKENNNGLKVIRRKPKNNVAISAVRLKKIMPTGRYLFEKKHNGGFIFKYQEKNE